jgi:hypothetical protein
LEVIGRFGGSERSNYTSDSVSNHSMTCSWMEHQKNMTVDYFDRSERREKTMDERMERNHDKNSNLIVSMMEQQRNMTESYFERSDRREERMERIYQKNSKLIASMI